MIAEHRLPAGQRADRQRRGIDEGEHLRDLGEHPMIHGQLLCPTTVPRRVAGTHHPVPDGETDGRATGRGDDARELVTQDHPPTRLGATDRAHERLSRIHADRADFDQYVAIAEPRLVGVDQLQCELVETVCPLVGQRLHESCLRACRAERGPPPTCISWPPSRSAPTSTGANPMSSNRSRKVAFAGASSPA